MGGAERQLIELVKGINKEKYNIIVGCLYDSKELWSTFQDSDRVEVICFYRKHKYDFFFLINMINFFGSHKIDIIQLYLTPTKFFGLITGLFFRIPIKIITERGTKFKHPTIGSFIYTTLENLLMKFANVIVANSEAGKRFVRKKGIKELNIEVIYNGIDISRISPNRKKEDVREEFGIKVENPVIGMVATLTPKKDHYTFLKSARKVINKHAAVRFLIVGDGALKQKLEYFSRKLALEPRVIFIGARYDIADIINIFDVAVLSSINTEGCSNFILEAMGMKKPVIATDVGGNNELIINNLTGKIVPKQDPDALAEAINWMIENPYQARQFGERGYERFKEHFIVGRMIKDYEDLYIKLLRLS